MMTNFPEYTHYDGLGLAQLVRNHEVTPDELVEVAIGQIEKLNPQINAVIHKLYDQARALAANPLPAGPFQGVPFLLKDLVSTLAGAPLCSGSRFYKDYRSSQDTEVVKRYKATGLIILGKTNTPEFGLTPYTEPELFGPTRNPWDLARIAGGSSGGSAAAVAAGMVPIAGGGDGGGSIRIPASCCGIFGFKPSRGRVPTGPEAGENWQGFTVEHVLTRSVRDSAAMLDAIAGPDVGAPYYAPPPDRPFLTALGETPGSLRIAFTTKPFLGHNVHPDCVCGVETTAKLLTDLGHQVEEAAPEFEGYAFAQAFFAMVCADIAAGVMEAEARVGRKARYHDFEPSTWVLHLMGKQLNAGEFVQAKHFLQRTSRQIAQFFEKYDLLLTPTLAEPPANTGSLQPKGNEALAIKALGRLNAGPVLRAARAIETTAEKVFDFTPYTPVFNVTGQPAMSVPLYWNAAGLPIGIHFVGRYADEATLFRLAGQLEQARPWFHRRPRLE